ncbi:MAG: restriction endonuclease subunit S [Ferruginibacter sp.]
MTRYTLRDLFLIKNGKDHKHLGHGEIPVLGSGGIMRYADKALFESASILLPRKGSLSNIQYIDQPFWTVDTLYYTIVNQKLANTYYLYNLLKILDLSSLNSGTGVPSMTFDAYYDLEILLPQLSVQRKIASALYTLDNKIELNNRINTELEVMAKTIYDYWFVQFDFPDKKGKPYKSSGGKMVYSEVLKRQIPKGWLSKNLEDFIAADKNGDWGKDESEGNYTTKVECIRGTDINGINGKGEVKAPLRFILEKNEGKILTANDLVIEISGGSPIQSTGRLACITSEAIERFKNPLICSNFCKAVSLKNENALFYFVCSWNRAYDNGIFFGFEGKTSGIKNLLFDTLVSHYYIPQPDNEILKEFQNKLLLFEKQKQKNLKQNQELASLRDWLLPMLMNGQVSVGKDDEHVGEVLAVAVDAIAHDRKTMQLPIPKNKTIFAKQVLAGRIVSLFKEDKNFTHIKFQKLQFLAEHIGEADLALNYYFQSAGPYDNIFMHTVFNSFKKSKWFDERSYKFVALEKQDQIEKYYQDYFKPIENRLEKLFNSLKNKTEAESEIIATMYAVWNNRLILKQPISEQLLEEDFYNWSSRKSQYKKRQLLEAINWLKKNGFEPKGFGNEIKRAKKVK